MRKIISNQLKQINNKNIALLFSGGMDSLSLLLSCIDVGISPHLYTFRLENYISEDIISSRKIAKTFNLKYTEVVIKENIENLASDVFYIIKEFKVKKKTQVQCIYPFIHMVNIIQEDIVISGLCADDLYGTSRKMQVLGRKSELEFNKKRVEINSNEQSSSYIYIKKLFNMYNKEFIAPYKDNIDLINFMLNKSFKELHSPKQKNVMYENYKKELETYKLYRRNSNLQVNSKVREFHDRLLSTDLNKNNYKSIVGIYNTIYKYYYGGETDV